MWEWLVPLISAGIEGAETFFGDKSTRRRYEPSEYEQMLINTLLREYKGKPPAWLTSLYYGQARKLEKQFARQPGVSGEISAIKSRNIFAPMQEAIERYRSRRLSALAGLTGGMGETIVTEPKDYSSALMDLGYALPDILEALKKKKGIAGQGGGYSGYYPETYRYGRERSTNYPYLYD